MNLNIPFIKGKKELTVNNEEESSSSTEDKAKENTVSFAIDKDLFITPGLNNEIDDALIQFVGLGRIDGTLIIYQKEPIKEISELKAKQIIEKVRAIINQRSTSISKEMEIKGKRIAKLDDDSDRAKRYYESQSEYNNKNPKDSSLFNGWLYLTIGTILLIADIPITMTITRVVFGLGESKKGSFDINVLLLALAISGLSFLLKILYDEVINNPLGHFVNQFKGIAGIDTAREKLYTQIEYFLKLIIHLLFAMGTLYLIYSLGGLRAKVLENVYYPHSGLKFLNDNPKEIRTTLVLLTTLIPLTVGVLISKCNSNFLNHLKLKEKLRNYETALANYSKAKEELEDVSKKLENIKDASVEWLILSENGHSLEQNDRTISPVEYLKKLFIAAYEYGYQRGLMGRPTQFYEISDQFERAEFYKSRENSLKLRNFLKL